MEKLMKGMIAGFLECQPERDAGMQNCKGKASLLFGGLKKKFNRKNGRLPDTGAGHGLKEPAGMDLGDMVHLVYIMDAYRKLNITCYGEEIMMGFDEGCIGALSRIYKVIEHNACADMRKDDFKKGDKILLDGSLTPEQRAKKLLGK